LGSGIDATDEEKRQLAMKGYSDCKIIADGPSKIAYHDPNTGKEFVLPADPYNLTHYLARGFAIGPASADLKAKYESTEPKIITNTVYGTELPPELRDVEKDKLHSEINELRDMMKELLAAQTSGASVPLKDDIIEVEEEITEEQVPFDTQLGLI
jgi:hypothetical protein